MYPPPMRPLPHPIDSTELAAELGGVHHGPAQQLLAVSPLTEDAPGRLCFALSPPAQAHGCVLSASPIPGTCIVVPDPKAAFAQALRHLFAQHLSELGGEEPSVHPTAVCTSPVPAGIHIGPGVVVESEVTLAPGCILHAGAVVRRGCRIGPRTVLHPRVVLYPHVQLGADCVIHAGAVLGGPGFGLHPGSRGLEPLPHVGRLILEDGVRVGANCTIDRAFIETTLIGQGVMLDAQVHIGHNTVVGAGSVIAAQSGLSGSVRLEPGVILGGQVGVVDHITIGSTAQVGAGSGVMRDIPAGEVMLGSPADKKLRTLRRWARWRKE